MSDGPTYEQPTGGADPAAGSETTAEQARCSACRNAGLEPGFIEDAGQSSQGYARWIAGELQRGIFGGASRLGKQRWVVEAWRCTTCGHLELYARTPS